MPIGVLDHQVLVRAVHGPPTAVFEGIDLELHDVMFEIGYEAWGSHVRDAMPFEPWCTMVCRTLEGYSLVSSVSIMSIDHDDLTAPWLQLATILRDRIASGEYASGKRLPSLVALEEEFGLNPKTIRKAIESLKADGLVVTSPGRGTFVKPAEPDSGEDGG